MVFELLVGLQVSDEARYQKYREGIRHILEEHGGFFRYDFKISEVLKSQSRQPMNRVFILAFPDRERMETFFANEQYRAVRSEWFESAVDSVEIISEYERGPT